jgi:hypothetical protein
MTIGYWHTKSQWRVEQEAMFRENVIGARIWLYTIKLIEAKASEEEKDMIDFLSTIESKKFVASPNP